MLNQLIDAVLGFIESAKPIEVLDPTQRGWIMRLGRKHREIGPGPHLLIPFVDAARYDTVIRRTMTLDAQSLVSKDGEKVVVSVIVSCFIYDIKKALFEIEDVDKCMREACQGVVGEMVPDTPWPELKTPDFRKALLHQCRLRAEEMGMKIVRLQLRDLTTSWTVRLIGDNVQNAINN